MIARTLLLALYASIMGTLAQAQVNSATPGWFPFNGFQSGAAGNIGLCAALELGVRLREMT